MREITCAQTGMRLVPAGGETGFRVAKDRYGALSVRHNAHVGPLPVGTDPDAPDSRNRYDAIGSTVYLADSRRCAYAEVLGGFRQDRAKIADLARTIGMTVDEFIEAVTADARVNGCAVPWAIPVDWQMQRSVYEIQLPRTGWWVKIDHPDTLAALETLAAAALGATGQVTMLTATEVTGLDRGLTTLLAHTIREQLLFDGSEPLGIAYRSRTMLGDCWAWWDRRAELGLPRGSNDLLQISSENVGPDPELAACAQSYKLPVCGR